MGSLRGIKTEVRADEKAQEARKREAQDKQFEQDYLDWLSDPERHYKQYFRPSCLGCIDDWIGPSPCEWCLWQDNCIDIFWEEEGDPRVEELEQQEWLEDMEREETQE
ncbi:MAG: hypothetical protein HY913_04200 [Desulfomonile tiedjei]|nr:hypothetical protein [Desulfomonile tiedjei]